MTGRYLPDPAEAGPLGMFVAAGDREHLERFNAAVSAYRVLGSALTELPAMDAAGCGAEWLTYVARSADRFDMALQTLLADLASHVDHRPAQPSPAPAPDGTQDGKP